MALSVEGKMVSRLRDLLKADTTVKGYFGDRVYDSHVATITEPEFPCISLTVIDSRPADNIGDVVEAVVQVDIWSKERGAGKRLIYDYQKAVRAAVKTLKNGVDSATGLNLELIRELIAGQPMFESDTGIWHKPMRYDVRAA